MLTRRHQEYVLLHNAECDAPNPRGVLQLRAELRRMERSWRQKANAPLGLTGTEADFEESTRKYRRNPLAKWQLHLF